MNQYRDIRYDTIYRAIAISTLKHEVFKQRLFQFTVGIVVCRIATATPNRQHYKVKYSQV